VRWQLSGCGDFRRHANAVDLAKLSELFGSDWPAAEDVNLGVVHSDNGRFDAMRGRASVNNQRDASTQFTKNVLSSCGANPTKPICAWRGERFPERGNDFSENRMRTHPDGNCVEPSGDDVWNNWLSAQNKRQRSRPELRDHLLDLRARTIIDLRNALEPVFSR